MASKLNKRIIAILVVTAGCHELGPQEKVWGVGSEIAGSVQSDGNYTTSVQFELEEDVSPVVLKGVKVEFLTAEEVILNETTLGTVRFERGALHQFNVSTPERPYYVYLKYDEVEQPTDAVGGVSGLRLRQSAEGEYRYSSYRNYTAEY
ncbi:hypothetical protein ACFQMA_18085 [Halosimplex aquaticum]|uniref:Uncharacterized protein n=1 Tax=Halosimplex aquaticum TaxID=3026162 RepID=A0ABD5Y310_9EURY|nr:hypothetical protein [Halosimplex aquaticum]